MPKSVTSGVSSEFAVVGRRFTIRKLRVRNVPAAARIQLRCDGRGCPVRRLTRRPLCLPPGTPRPRRCSGI